MSIPYLNAAMDAKCESGTEKLVLLILANYANKNGACWPSMPSVAKRCSLSARTVVEQVAKLAERGWLEVDRTKGKSNHYILKIPVKDVHQCGSLTSEADSLPPVKDVHHYPCITRTTPVQTTVTNHKEPSSEPSIEPPKEKRAKIEKQISKAIPESEDEVKAFCKENGLTSDDASYMWNKWEGNGFENGGKKIKNWKAVIRSWKHGGWFPSQKAQSAPAKPRYMTPAEITAEKVRKNPNYQ
jgi:hypothetical protein